MPKRKGKAPTKPEPIPGSKYFRNYCRSCGEPVRVVKKMAISNFAHCADCHPMETNTPGGSRGVYRTEAQETKIDQIKKEKD